MVLRVGGDTVSALRDIAAKATPAPWQECGACRGGCTCGNVWSVPADVPVGRAISDRELSEQGWERIDPEIQKRDARLMALAPELAVLVDDLAELVEKTIYNTPGWTGPDVWWAGKARALLARRDALAERAREEARG
jgi:hypothetical protein